MFWEFIEMSPKDGMRTSPGHLRSSGIQLRQADSDGHDSGNRWLLSGSRAALPAPFCHASVPSCLLPCTNVSKYANMQT
jgi:hypothetical protein